jgi:tetratricopeptide (TPR) repeat protein
MAKRSKRKKAVVGKASSPGVAQAKVLPQSRWRQLVARSWIPLLLAAITFIAYGPSLQSDFVYDARKEILEEGFITSFSNLGDVLSLKVLGMNLMLGDRPGDLLYLMLIAAFSGKEPFGYHLCSNLLHAANAALLFVLLARLTKVERPGLTGNAIRRAQLAMAVVTLIFALHPLAVETVANVSYSSDLLVTCFTLLALLAATAFQPDKLRSALVFGGAGVLCAFAAVASKESGLAAAGLLIVYWFLFRRRETKGPWLWFLTAATAVTVAFLAAHFLLAPANPYQASYLGGSLSQVFLIQPRLWVFMMGKLFWPAPLSADYTLENISGLSTPLALAVLVLVVLLQAWLARRSRLGALGVAIYWLGLATVSNFIPLYRFLGDRFYYLPLVGVALQLLALLLMTVRLRHGYWGAMAPCLVALLPLTLLTLNREEVFRDDFSLWTYTLQASPFSSSAHNGLGDALFQKGRVDEAVLQFEKALEISPKFSLAQSEARNNFGNALLQKGDLDKAIDQIQMALEIDPTYAEAHNNLGTAFSKKGQIDEAIVQFEWALKINPTSAEIHYNLGNAFLRKKQIGEAIVQFKKTLEINPAFAVGHNNLGLAFYQEGQLDEAIAEYQKALEINPGLIRAHTNLGAAFVQKGQMDQAVAQFQEAAQLNPNDRSAQSNLAKAQALAQRVSQ